MNTFNTTLVSPTWAEESELGDDGNQFLHRGPEVSVDPLIHARIERLDSLTNDNTFTSRLGHSICMHVDDNGEFNSSGIDIDLDEDSMGDPADLARRIAAQLLIAADALDSARAADAG